MFGIPRIPFWLGAAGLLPFLLGATMQFLHEPGGTQLLAAYGTVILCFMSGVLWGFATKSGGRDQFWAYGLSVVPALYVFFFVENTILSPGRITGGSLPALWFGFAGILLLDVLYQMRGLAPRWWMRLRLIITAVVLACLYIGANI
jgi:hypothetical protein